MRSEPDNWLESIFGQNVFRIVDFENEPRVSVENLKHTLQTKDGFYYSKLPVRRTDLVHSFERAGFTVVDINVSLECSPVKMQISVPSRINIRDVTPEDTDALLAIAESCFLYSRFHMDPLIPQKLANAVKREWVANYCRGARGERLLVADCAGVPLGFLAITRIESEKIRFRIIDLVGIRPDCQRKGIGTYLIKYFIDNSVEQCDRLRVGTQIANTASLNLYQRCGFEISGASFVVHAHVHEGRVL